MAIVVHCNVEQEVAQMTSNVQSQVVEAESHHTLAHIILVDLWIKHCAPHDEISPTQHNTQIAEKHYMDCLYAHLNFEEVLEFFGLKHT